MFVYNFDSGVNFGGENYCGIFFRGNFLCGSWKDPLKSQKLEPAKIKCHTVLRCSVRDFRKKFWNVKRHPPVWYVLRVHALVKTFSAKTNQHVSLLRESLCCYWSVWKLHSKKSTNLSLYLLSRIVASIANWLEKSARRGVRKSYGKKCVSLML